VPPETVPVVLNPSTVVGPIGEADPTEVSTLPDQNGPEDKPGSDNDKDSDEEAEQGQTVGDFLLNPMGGQLKLNTQIEEPITGGSDIIDEVPGGF
jgi:hypothetical protein